MKLEDLERDILGAYLNYENNDLKTAVKQLDMSANSLLKDDKTLDPVWTSISKNVYISVILNNFSKGIEFSLKDLESMLNNQTLVYNNIIEFCNKFENSEEISFATTLKKISENPLKSAIQILKENIERITNIKENNNNHNTIKCFCGNEIQVDWSKIPNNEKTIYLKCPKCDSELKRGNPNYKQQKDYKILSYGTFVNLNNKINLSEYIINNDEKEKIKNAKVKAFEWIKNNQNYKIVNAEYSYYNAGYHDENGSSNTIKEQTEFKYDDLADIFFICKQENNDFKLKPTFKKLKIDNIDYVIPEIEIYNYSPEKIGLNNLN